MLDRIDLQIEIPRVDFSELQREEEEEDSYTVRKRVEKARQFQLERYKGTEFFNNAAMKASYIKKYCKLDKESKSLLKDAFNKLGLSARAHDRILKVARTIADLEGSDNIRLNHLAEAIQYRALERHIWE